MADQYSGITSVRNTVKQTRDKPFMNTCTTSPHVVCTQHSHLIVTTHGNTQGIASMQDSIDTIQSINASDLDKYRQFHYDKNNAPSYTATGNTVKRKSLEESTIVEAVESDVSSLPQDVIHIAPLDGSFLLSPRGSSNGQEVKDNVTSPKRRRLSHEVHVKK